MRNLWILAWKHNRNSSSWLTSWLEDRLFAAYKLAQHVHVI